MRTEFYDIYEMLYDNYIYDNNIRFRYRPYKEEYEIAKIIRKSIDIADKENTLRPDAKYFLLINFHHLIVKPLSERLPYREYRIDLKFEEIESDIVADISTIVSESKNETEGEISGHQIMSTIDRLWKVLRTTRLEIWG